MIRIAVLAVDEQVVDAAKQDGQTVNFETAGDTSPASIVRRNIKQLIAELKKYNYVVDFAELGYLDEGIVDNLITGVRSMQGELDEQPQIETTDAIVGDAALTPETTEETVTDVLNDLAGLPAEDTVAEDLTLVPGGAGDLVGDVSYSEPDRI